ncbi:hypothetical protein PGT21_009851 [Puccinia graminis f. sp. tritici]|uniref:Uncharacterized protein n=1 Tax=Puccinia graminis f. sp. tritici TaxID=56615 RepID=A0A5B0MXB3_PUCGR|nr:hypothetical protein PGT21_009851 [Puccinia graminis f. sp. tritici]KAA1131476.1 hypothetical protein PGTUg99_018861 [Puccinia graminis f. sp. tritici]
MFLISGRDETMPSTVDKERFLQRLVDALTSSSNPDHVRLTSDSSFLVIPPEEIIKISDIPRCIVCNSSLRNRNPSTTLPVTLARTGSGTSAPANLSKLPPSIYSMQ